MKVINTLNFKAEKVKHKFFTMPSETVPDQTMSIREIMERYAKGLPVGDGYTEIYDEDPETQLGINIKSLDLVDIQELKGHAKDRIQEIRNTTKEQAAKALQQTQSTEQENSTNNP